MSVFPTILSTKSLQICQFSADKTICTIPFWIRRQFVVVYMKLNFLYFFLEYLCKLSSGRHNPISTVLGFALKEIT